MGGPVEPDDKGISPVRTLKREGLGGGGQLHLVEGVFREGEQ